MCTRRFIIAFLVLACALRAESVTVTLLATTDLHGYIYPYDYYTGKPAVRGLAKIATLIRQARSQNPNTLLIDCGDTIQGSPLESVYQDSLRNGKTRQDPMMLAMDELGYAAMVLGNHEFDFGLKNLESARADARFPWLSANVIPGPAAGLKRFDAYVVKTVGGVRVAIVGITTPSVCAVAAGAGNGALRCLAGVEAAEAAVREVRQRQHPDLVVVAIHAGLGKSGDNMVTAVAERVPGVDAIVYGHSHQQQAGLRVGGVLLVQPRNWGASLARLDFVLEKTAAGWKLTDKRSRLIPAGKQVAADPEVLGLAKPYHDSAERYLKTPLFESAAGLSGALGRVRDNALVDAIHEVQLHYAQADVSFASMFDLGVRIRQGPVTVREIAALYPYENELYAVEGDGRMVKAALENSARYYLSCRDALCAQGPLINRGVAGFNYDTAQGVTYEIDLSRRAGERIQNLRWQGRPLLPTQKLRIAINNYRASGRGGYDVFRKARVLWRSNEDLRDLIVRYFTERRSLPLKPDDNWRVTPEGARRTLQAEVERNGK